MRKLKNTELSIEQSDVRTIVFHTNEANSTHRHSPKNGSIIKTNMP